MSLEKIEGFDKLTADTGYTERVYVVILCVLAALHGENCSLKM